MVRLYRSLAGAALIVLGARGALALAPTRLAAPAPPAHGVASLVVEQVGVGQIRISRGGKVVRLDLRADIEGCKTVTFDPMTKQRWPAEVQIERVDESESASFLYVVLLAQAMSNCNIQGECGASEGDSTLIWLKLGKDLALAGKQAVLFDSCLAKAAQIAADRDETGFAAKDLPWVGDVLRIEVDAVGRDASKGWRLSYDHGHPEAGLRWDAVQAPPGY